jgi:fumarate reductase subunit D
MMKRSIEPIVWLLFGAGGVLSALIAPGLVLVTGVLGPLGVLPKNALGYPHVLAIAQHPLGKLLLLAVISLFLFHGCHRVVTTLHDFGLKAGHGVMALFFGGAALASLLAAGLLLGIGF